MACQKFEIFLHEVLVDVKAHVILDLLIGAKRLALASPEATRKKPLRVANASGRVMSSLKLKLNVVLPLVSLIYILAPFTDPQPAIWPLILIR